MTSNDHPTPGGTFPLGDQTVARIGYGTMQLAERPGRPPVTGDEAVAILRHAVELGITHFDTAEFYGEGTANGFLREALRPFDGIVLATKVGARRDPSATPSLVAAQKPHELREQVEQNLSTLGAERLDVVNLRRADAQPGIIATGDQVVPLDDQLAELAALRDESKIGAIGLSNVSIDQLRQALPVGIACVQNAYNLVERSAEAVLDLCAANGVAWVPFFPLGSGFPGVPKVTDEPVVRDTAARLGATPSQVGLAWLLAHSPNTLIISGTSSADHLDENAAAGDLILDGESMAALDALVRP
ncbi:aldo/keto reductase [Frondihabitans sp. PAMC 28766]|uniref:aldo/keto reductase n=1 Tax=Frondihabitans sp. PAMC 28766 TaxID=1795630 RepID=UPI00078E5C0B|nr:aldo/keto reductase [Frondihabitans sp. PAMC 28766]AMM18880.1 aldo/keto reductase [Frondihabitans sp. PAMC 28766]